MVNPEDKDETTALLDVAQNSALDHIHDTCESAESTLILTVYKDASGDWAASSCLRGNSFALVGCAKMWLASEIQIRDGGS